MIQHLSSIQAFRFVCYEFDEQSATAKLHYALDDRYQFTETLQFPGSRLPLDDARRDALERCLQHLHLVAGVSYYKAAIPPEISVETSPLSPATADFLEQLYFHGLGEFAYRNQLDLRDKIRFPRHQDCQEQALALELPRRTAVPVGGGKDSVIAIEVLRQANEPMVLFSVGNPLAIREVAAQAGINHIVVHRRISPLLLELNAQGALNGHVPISAIIAFILAAASVLYGFDAVAMANEKSASYGNLLYHGYEINHQYSKSLGFERLVDAHFRQRLLANFRYFSLLRPLSEMKIAQIFSDCQHYHDIFTSCNAAFRLDEKRRCQRWCCDCPKCRFVFLILAPFFVRDRLTAIFGRDLLDDEEQASGFDELIGQGEHKPFECVGEQQECLAAFILLSRQSQWADVALVRRFSEQIKERIDDPDSLVASALAWHEEHAMPKRYEEILRAYLRS